LIWRSLWSARGTGRRFVIPTILRQINRIRRLTYQQIKGGVGAMSDLKITEEDKDWPHAPLHRLDNDGVYMITAATLYKKHYFAEPDKLTYLEKHLLSLAKRFNWQLEAWAVFSNHYHFIARSLADAESLRQMISQLHSETAAEANRLDGVRERKVWFNFWDTKLTYQRSYLARLNYVHQNPVKHGLVKAARDYEWCSAAWFERTASRATVKTIYSFKTDQLNIYDDF
jgi:putative transposase